MPDWLLWLIAAGVLAAAEVTTLTFVLAMFAGGALAGSITAAMFLKEFVADTPWVHLDIAGTAYSEKGNTYSSKGANGAALRTFVELASPSPTEGAQELSNP